MQSIFIERYDPTIEDSFRKSFQIKDFEEPILLEILDTAGTEQFAAMRDLYFRNGDGFILMYSVTSPMTLKEVEDLWELQMAMLRRRQVQSKLPVVLVGNKLDLVEDRQISTQKGQDLGARWDVPFIETSARTRINVDEAFEVIVKRIMEIERESNEMQRRVDHRRKKKCLIM